MPTENQPIKEGALDFSDLVNDFTFEIPGQENEAPVLPTTEIDFSAPASEETSAEEETKTETTEVKEEEKKPVIEVEKENPFYTLTKKLIETGKWSDANIEDGEGNTIKLSEYKDLSEDEYLELLDKQKEFENEEVESKYIKAEGADEDKKRIANIVLNGGDLKEIFQTPEAMVKPFSEELGWDLDNEQHQASIVYQHFLSQGMSKKQAETLVKAAQEELNLDTQAQQIVKYHQELYTEKLKEVEDNLLKERAAETERKKAYRSDLSKIYKEQKLPETLSKKLVDLATKENSDGELLIDELYNKVMQDPKEAQEVILFLADREAYLKSRMFETKNKTQTETFRTISLLPKDKSKKVAKEEDTTGDFVFEIPTT